MSRAALLGVVVAGCGRIGFDDIRGDAGTGYPGAVLADQPVGYWRFDDVASGVAKDLSPSGLDGSYIGSVVTVGGALADGNDAAELDGTGTTFVALADDVRLEPGAGSFTFEVWLRFPLAAWLPYVDLVGKRTNCGSTDSFWNMIGYPSHELASELRDGTQSKAFDVMLGIPDTNWHHYVRALDRAGTTITTYVDAVPVDTRSAAGLGTVAAAAPLRTDCALDSVGLGVAYGIDELAIYDDAIGSDRVLAHFMAAQ